MDTPVQTDLMKALQVWAKGVTGFDALRVIWENQDGPKPLKPFVKLNIWGPMADGLTDWMQDDLSAMGGERQYTVSVQAVTDPPDGTLLDAFEYASNLLASLMGDPAVEDQLSAAGIGVADINQVQNLSELLDTKTERRAQFDFQINVASNRAIGALPTIETAPVPQLGQ